MPGKESNYKEQRFRALIEHNSDTIALTDQNGVFTYVSSASIRIPGYTAEELVGTNAFDLIHPDDRERVLLDFTALLDSPGKFISLEYRLRRKDGTWCWLEGITTNLLQNPTIGAFMHSYRDITERKRSISARLYAEKELINEQTAHAETETARGRLYDMFMQAPALFCVLRGPQHIFEFANPLYLQTMGNRDLVGKSIRQALPELADQGFFELLDQVYSTGKLFRGYEIKASIDRNSNGKLEEHIFNFVYQPLRNAHEEIDGILVHAVDVTEHKAAERRKEEFLSMVSHELRTPLTSIQGFLELALIHIERLPSNLPSELYSIIHKIEIALQRAEQQMALEHRLVEELLDVSRIEVHKFDLSPQLCNLSKIVQEAITYQQQATPAYTLKLQLPPNISVPVLVDEDRIKQVLGNYLDNAVKYSPSEKPILVKLSIHENIARVSVCDHGPGLTLDQQQQIWERFYQTGTFSNRNINGGGLGLGLYIARIIIWQHQGRVGVESRLGQGATFWFTLPLAPL